MPVTQVAGSVQGLLQQQGNRNKDTLCVSSHSVLMGCNHEGWVHLLDSISSNGALWVLRREGSVCVVCVCTHECV